MKDVEYVFLLLIVWNRVTDRYTDGRSPKNHITRDAKVRWSTETSNQAEDYPPAHQGLEEQNWYVGPFSRVDSEHALHLVNREGAFLVRDCSRNTTQEPFVLAVFYDKRVFNIQIRFCEETCKYTLGTGLRNSEVSSDHTIHMRERESAGSSRASAVLSSVFQRFDSVTDIIKFHSIFPIILIDGRKILAATNPRRHSVLMYPVTKQDMTELLR
ncbi:Cytokine-dependent hematopoietic cell linker [Triplophysa tibetana]|uniref:Cytokine-dependent hematopoietic cell linker n=1 Tax=Triplophysa tibetana TaxID=1572043 RepID=A0A5A9NJ90_9TELE|nr:Cytokine-dependent hematopoietic cell linker [Triplophysa tibetana]